VNCPVCSQPTIILKTRDAERRRACTVCPHRFTTTEVLKEDHNRQQEAVQTVIEVAERLKAAA
jgi:transcriptional regulator NrdR family protein